MTKDVTLSTAQQRAYGRLTEQWQCAYTLGASLATLDALVKKGCAQKRAPKDGIGVMFSPRTSYEFKLK